MQSEFIIVGAGIGGLAAALALGLARHSTCVHEQADAFTEAGAGIQLGPNAVRVLHGWGLDSTLDAVAARPERLQALDASDGRVLGTLRLGGEFRQRYGTDYLTLHRGDLHRVLLQALDPHMVRTVCASTIVSAADEGGSVSATAQDGVQHRAGALLACDGMWSGLRRQLLNDGVAQPTGHLAYRAMLDSADVPHGVARDQVTLWLGAHMHAVAYPVRRGELFNLVVVLRRPEPADVNAVALARTQRATQAWDIASDAKDCLRALHGQHVALLDMAHAVPFDQWKRWDLHERVPLSGPGQMAVGRIALLGDAAHPMRPYLAQGAAMALEDAQALAQAVQGSPQNLSAAFERYAQGRWQRNARVQRKARRNGTVFHARGALRLARNLALRLAGRHLMDARWLYAQPKPD